MKPVGKPDAGYPHVRFDERGGETGCLGDTAPLLDSTGPRLFLCVGILAFLNATQMRTYANVPRIGLADGLERLDSSRDQECRLLPGTTQGS